MVTVSMLVHDITGSRLCDRRTRREGDSMWFDSWSDVIRILLVGSAGYATLLLILRVSGKRTLSQLNAFDFVVTVSLGSTLATLLLSSETSWSEGVLALALLAGLQFLVAWISARAPWVRPVITARPSILLRDGILDHVQMRRSRLSEAEIRQAVRMHGMGDLSVVGAVVLETNGKLSVIPSSQYGNGSAMDEVSGVPA